MRAWITVSPRIPAIAPGCIRSSFWRRNYYSGWRKPESLQFVPEERSMRALVLMQRGQQEVDVTKAWLSPQSQQPNQQRFLQLNLSQCFYCPIHVCHVSSTFIIERKTGRKKQGKQVKWTEPQLMDSSRHPGKGCLSGLEWAKGHEALLVGLTPPSSHYPVTPPWRFAKMKIFLTGANQNWKMVGTV